MSKEDLHTIKNVQSTSKKSDPLPQTNDIHPQPQIDTPQLPTDGP